MVTLRTLIAKPRGIPAPVQGPKPRAAWARLVATPPDPAVTVLRGVLGAVMFAHAAQKTLGLFGGPGFDATMRSFTETLGLPAPLAILVIGVELLSSVGLIVGFLGRLAALGVASIMAGAILLVHWPHGFFMNWFGTQQGEGFEFHLLVLAMTAAIMIRGSGAWSLDRLLSQTAPSPLPVEGPHAVEELRHPARSEPEHRS
jgi:putative oxidoreductase